MNFAVWMVCSLHDVEQRRTSASICSKRNLERKVSVTWIFLNSGFGFVRLRAEWLANRSFEEAKVGGACRDRTDDLKLAKLALSQLS
jgi:hypothetical protein